MSFRIGQGFDVHAFRSAAGDDPGDQVILGGISIPHDRGLKAHSDGDVLLHALADALLGALALGDIGHHFPDTDPRFAGADSRELLRHVMGLIAGRGYGLVNADMTLIAQAPKMAPHIEGMRANIAADCGVDVDAVSVKATTSERLGFTGRGEGIAAQAVVLLERVDA